MDSTGVLFSTLSRIYRLIGQLFEQTPHTIRYSSFSSKLNLLPSLIEG
ncbi:MAG: hypothetical protein ACFE9S_18945 [Candidatus Hermodarchaeota archaeon]